MDPARPVPATERNSSEALRNRTLGHRGRSGTDARHGRRRGVRVHGIGREAREHRLLRHRSASDITFLASGSHWTQVDYYGRTAANNPINLQARTNTNSTEDWYPTGEGTVIPTYCATAN